MFFLNGLSYGILQKLVVVCVILTISICSYTLIHKKELKDEIEFLKKENATLKEHIENKNNFLRDKHVEIVPQKGQTAAELRKHR